MSYFLTWRGYTLKHQYHVDHCLPFSYWPNNDKWNLLPTIAKEKLFKSDKLPTAGRLYDSKRRIIDWWQLAWGANQQRFLTEASLSLPNLSVQW